MSIIIKNIKLKYLGMYILFNIKNNENSILCFAPKKI